MNKVLGNVLKLIGTNIGTPNAPWMNRIASECHPTPSLKRINRHWFDHTPMRINEKAPLANWSQTVDQILRYKLSWWDFNESVVDLLPSHVTLGCGVYRSTHSRDHRERDAGDAQGTHAAGRWEAEATRSQDGEGGGWPADREEETRGAGRDRERPSGGQ